MTNTPPDSNTSSLDGTPHENRLRKNISLEGRRTCISLEKPLWDCLGDIARTEKMTPSQLCEVIYKHCHSGSFTSNIRTFILAYYRAVHQLAVKASEQSNVAQPRQHNSGLVEQAIQSLG